MSTTNGLTKSVWAEYVEHSGEEVFSITHAIYNPSYVEWLESELRAARQNTKVADQTPTNKQMVSALDDIRAVVFGRGDSVTKMQKVQDLITRLNATKA